ncbi:hypothetical protein KMW28_27065 [Flammeovirga yaeyamensis]|uniref:Uncharacterized protein n=1 Tax=Flammeovirga yaeyamensis TaxID=367791 RepID=A0AAX1NAK8_9BACT|nr:hypothetical protein [Flammeovirga yaeyamensis]MBB3700060.1 hypothetical protein [Flammeovirga yaeyamensis]NMF37504.1 hypothetical protein [Flammeovirga yaeyamensis]QWG04561.1 hypothetical protein KMW28_27065 [Flammeovirga yaeyamensis]
MVLQVLAYLTHCQKHSLNFLPVTGIATALCISTEEPQIRSDAGIAKYAPQSFDSIQECE